MKISVLAGSLLIAVPIIAFAQTRATRTVTIDVKGPAVIGFFPPVKGVGDDNPDDGVIEGTAHLSNALEDTGECLKKSGITAQVSLETASTLVVKENGDTRRVVLPKPWGKAVGAYFIQTWRAGACRLRGKEWAWLADGKTSKGCHRVFFGVGV